MKKALLLITLISSLSSQASDFYWGNYTPFSTELSLELSRFLKERVILANDNQEECVIRHTGYQGDDPGKECYSIKVNEYECEKEATGVQGEYDYICDGKIYVLRNGVKERLKIKFDILSTESRQQILVREVL